MDVSRDYSWSGSNYSHPHGLPAIGTTPSAIRQQRTFALPSTQPQFTVKQNRNFGDRWHCRKTTEMSRHGPASMITDYDPNSTSFPLQPIKRITDNTRIARPGYYNELERDLYSYLPPHRAGFYPYKEQLPPRMSMTEYRNAIAYQRMAMSRHAQGLAMTR